MDSEGLTLGRADVCPRCGVCKGCYDDIRRELGLNEDVAKSAYARGARAGSFLVACVFIVAALGIWALNFLRA